MRISPDVYCKNESCPSWLPNNHCKRQHILLDKKGICQSQYAAKKAKEGKEKKEQKQFSLMGA